MEAEMWRDTVMSDEKLNTFLWLEEIEPIKNELHEICQAQAEISFKMGEKQGYDKGWNDAKKYDRKQMT